MKKIKHIVFIVLFLGIIYGVPVVQALLEIADDESPMVLEIFEQAPSEENLRSFEADIEEYSFFEEHLRPVYQLTSYITLQDMGAKAIRGIADWTFFRPGIRYLVEPYFRDIEEANIQASGAVVTGGEEEGDQGGDPVEVIVDFAKQMRSRGIELLVVLVPGKASIYPDKLTSLANPQPSVWANTSRFKDELEENGVEVLALHDIFHKKRPAADQRGEHLYMVTDTHFTGYGARLAARAVAERIRKMDLLEIPTGENPFLRRKVTIARRGYIPEMTKIPLQEWLFGTEWVDCYQVTRADSGELYADDPASPLLWLGDSFSRVFQTDEPRAAGMIANLAFELGRGISSIVNDGGASTLVRQQLARKPGMLSGKRLIVWEFIERDIRFGMRGWQHISYAVDRAD